MSNVQFSNQYKKGIFDTPFNLYKENSFHLIEESMYTYFYELNSPKCKQQLNISEKGFY